MDLWTASWIIPLLLMLKIIYRCMTKPYEYWSEYCSVGTRTSNNRKFDTKFLKDMESWTLTWIILVPILLRMLYRYLTKPFNYWKDRGVPSVPAIPILGSVGELYSKSMKDVIADRYRKYGRVHGFYESTRPVIAIGDPELLKDILVKDFHIFPDRRDFATGEVIVDKMVSSLQGEEWKRVRTMITPAFTSGRIKRTISIMVESAKITTNNFDKYAKSGKPVDFKRLLGAYTLDVIARSSFGTTLDSHNDPESKFVRMAREAFQTGLSLRFLIFFICPELLKLFRTSVLKPEPLQFFRKVALEILKHRRETGKVYNDFLQLLMDANDEITKGSGAAMDEKQQDQEDDADQRLQDMGHDELNKGVFKSVKKYKGLSEDEIISQCIIFFLAGYETTASTLSFASYLLALNPECQEQLIKEIDDVLRESKGNLTYDAVQSMKYLENVVWETLRMYPPGLITERKALEDYKLGNTGITIKKGMIVQIPIYGIHHDPEFYENPEAFNPNRFSAEAKAERNPYTYLPFGAGPRNCIGMRFALIETKFCLVVLLSRFRFKRCAETKVPLQFAKGGQGILQLAGGIMLEVEERKNKIDVV